jgi:antibiotic biosynthesis monooxygenase (ABM) superfamily enzyme
MTNLQKDLDRPERQELMKKAIEAFKQKDQSHRTKIISLWQNSQIKSK